MARMDSKRSDKYEAISNNACDTCNDISCLVSNHPCHVHVGFGLVQILVPVGALEADPFIAQLNLVSLVDHIVDVFQIGWFSLSFVKAILLF